MRHSLAMYLICRRFHPLYSLPSVTALGNNLIAQIPSSHRVFIGRALFLHPSTSSEANQPTIWRYNNYVWQQHHVKLLLQFVSDPQITAKWYRSRLCQ